MRRILNALCAGIPRAHQLLQSLVEPEHIT